MKLLFVGDLRFGGRTLQRYCALRDLGVELYGISYFPEGSVVGQGGDGILHKALWKAGVPISHEPVNRNLVELANELKPDVVWIEKGNPVWPRTLRSVRRSVPGCRLISYSEDDMYAKHNRSLLYTRGLSKYDIVFTTKSYNADPGELPSLGARRVVFVDKAYDRTFHRPMVLTEEERRAYGAEVGFVGTYEPERAESLLFLAENGVSVRVRGARWELFRKRHRNLHIDGYPVYGEEYTKVICATKINLCFLRKENRDLQTDRTMEIPACGAFMLAERTEEHRRLFEEGKEAAYFGSDEELLSQVRYYLAHEEERRRIAAAGRRRCESSGYSHHDRLAHMLRAVIAEWGRYRPRSMSMS